MKNLVQIICGCGAAETIEECARVPQALGATIIVVHGIWPRLNHPNSDAANDYSDPSRWVSPTHQIDDVAAIAKRNGWHFIQMDKFAFNGEQYNVALAYIRQHNIACDTIWFVDSDECIDPADTPALLAEVELFRQHGIGSVRFHKRTEIVRDWRGFSYDITGGNYGIVMGAALQLERETYFDGNFFFKTPISYGLTSVPLLHLHHFRKNAASRVHDGIWEGGGMKVDLSTVPALPETDYIRQLKAKYQDFHEDTGEYYLGNAVYADQAGKP